MNPARVGSNMTQRVLAEDCWHPAAIQAKPPYAALYSLLPAICKMLFFFSLRHSDRLEKQ